MKVFEWLIKISFWLQAFAAPVVVFTLIAVVLYSKMGNLSIAIFLCSVGFIGGIILAEFIRRKYGLETFFGKIYGSDKTDEKFEQRSK